MHGVQPLPQGEVYIPADPEDELRESPKHFRQMQIGLHGLDKARDLRNEPSCVIQNVEVLYAGGRVCPDQALIRGIAEVEGQSYDIRKTRIAPAVVFEYSSECSEDRDRGEKYRIYESLRVKEYFIFHIEELSLQGFRLRAGRLAPLKKTRQGRLRSRELGVELGVHEGFLRMYRGPEILLAGREKDAALAEKDAALARKDAALARKDAALAEKDAALAERDRLIEELRRKLEGRKRSGRR